MTLFTANNEVTASPHSRLARLKRNLAVLVAATLTILFSISGFAGCAVNKATGQRQFNLISESSEIEMGREADQQITASLALYPDSALQQYVRDLGAKLAAKCERPDLPWTFRLVDDPVVNAFALPGGFIYVTRGILAHLNSEAELAGVMGHEIGHVTGKHAVSRMSKAQILQIGLGVGQTLEPGLEKYSQLANTGLGVLFLKYSRDDETQADELGLRYMTRIGDDPHEMIGVMTMLDDVTQASGGGRMPEWLATHPNPGNRRENIESQVGTMNLGSAATTVNRDSYLQRLDGLVFGNDPRQGYFKGGTFYHPELKFLFVFPDGWQTENQVDAVMGVGPNQDVLIQITISQATSLDAAASQFLSQDGISSRQPTSTNINGLPARWAEFTAQSDQNALAGVAAFVSYGGNIYQILAYGTQAGWTSSQSVAEPSVRSFAQLSDPKILAVKPQRLQIVKLDRAMTLQDFVKRYPGPATIETLALINRVDQTSQMPVGKLIKNVVGDKLQ